MLAMWPCKGFDFSWEDWRFAVRACVSPPSRGAGQAALERRWAPAGHALACLTARSAFDLLLRARRWPAGDEIVFSALTVPAMPELARRHGLRPVPLDINPLTAEWDDDDLAARMGPRTRAVVLAHLFGARADIGNAIALAHERGATVVEDCAQAYAGPGWSGHPQADVSLFSFGPMKTATALGGALATIRDDALANAMRSVMRRDAVQPTAEYLRRVLAYGALKAASHPAAFGAAHAALDAVGQDVAALTQRLTRSVPANGVEAAIRRQPCAALLAVLQRRLREGDAPLERRRAAAAALHGALGPSVPVPAGCAARAPASRARRCERAQSDGDAAQRGQSLGAAETPGTARPHGHWVVPVLAKDGAALRRGLRQAGFDASHHRLQPVTDGHTPTPGARRLAEAICLAFDPAMPCAELRREGELTARLLAEQGERSAGEG